MKIYLATDHTGIELKNKVKDFLQIEGYEPVDCGAYTYDKDDDYPDFIHIAAQGVSKDPLNSKGIIFGGSGQGEAMTANKSKNVRCALFYTPAIPVHAINIEGAKSTDPFEMLKLTRDHNDANMLSIGFRFVKDDDVLKAVKIFLTATGPSSPRHLRRINKISKIEEEIKNEK